MDIALFSPSSPLRDSDESSNKIDQSYEERTHQFSGMVLVDFERDLANKMETERKKFESLLREKRNEKIKICGSVAAVKESLKLSLDALTKEEEDIMKSISALKEEAKMRKLSLGMDTPRDTLTGVPQSKAHFQECRQRTTTASPTTMDIALFSPSSLFGDSDESSNEPDQIYEERTHQFPGMELLIREFSFHELNANLLWPGTFSFATWLVDHRSWLQGRRAIELGSGTGALAIFLRKSFQLDITTSDYDDKEIEENIAHNCKANGVSPSLPHIKHSWGDVFPSAVPDWDLVIASDILLYVKQYANLINTLSFLLKNYKPKVDSVPPSNREENGEGSSELACCPVFLMSWRRRIGKEEEDVFFSGCENAGLQVQHLGSRVYCIKPAACENLIVK